MPRTTDSSRSASSRSTVWILTGSLVVATAGILLLSWETSFVRAARFRTSRVLAICGLGSSHAAPAKITAPSPKRKVPKETTAEVFAAIGEQYEPSLDAAAAASTDEDDSGLEFPGALTLSEAPTPSAMPATRQIPADMPPTSDNPFDNPFAEPKQKIVQTNLQVAAPAAEVARKEAVTAPAANGALPPRPTGNGTAPAVQAGSGAAPAGKAAALMEMSQIQKLIEAGDYPTAQKELSKWYWQTPAKRAGLRPTLDKLAQALYFAPQPQFVEPYVVQPGDQLRKIAQKYDLSWEYLAKLNRADPRKIRAGQKLKVVEGPFSVLVVLSNYELIVHHKGSFVKSYSVGLGKDGTTPVGTFPVKNKMADPTYFGPEGVIAHDDPQNPLGERWIDIGDSYGIHGTIDPESIGHNESRGCVRMLNSDVEEVYDLLVVGSEVRIQR